MFKKRRLEIEKRRKELREMLNATDADLDAIERESGELSKELETIERKERALEALRDKPEENGGNPMPPAPQERKFERKTVLGTKEYRSAFAKTLMGLPLDDTEQRALGVALTTTDSQYVEASESVDGINNGGLFIPQDLNLALMQEISLVSPIFNDIDKLSVPGVLSFPYLKDAPKAEIHKKGKEAESNTDAQAEWADLKLNLLEISVTIRVSWKLEKMSVDGFMSYLQSQIIEQVRDEKVTNVIYGEKDDELVGIMTAAIKGEYTGSFLDAAPEALKKLPKKRKIGAKFYVSNSIVEEISFTKDSNGNYIYTPINSAGIKSLATYQIEVDPYLNDGDFILGNLKRHYKLNAIEACSLSVDRSGKKRANDYTAYEIVGGNLQPNTVVGYTKKASTKPSTKPSTEASE